MAISSISTSEATATSGNDITVTAPASILDDDLLYALCFASGTGSVNTAIWSYPTGFTEVLSEGHNEGASKLKIAVAHKKASSESGDYTFSLDFSGKDRAVIMLVLRGVDTTTPIDVTYVKASHLTLGSTDDPPNKAITTNTNNAWVLTNGGVMHSNLTAWGAPTSYTLEEDIVGVHKNTAIASREITTAGLESPGNWQNTDSNNRVFATATIAIRPAVGASAIRIHRRIHMF